MEQTLKITNVLSDPTRFYIYQHIVGKHKEVTVQEIADSFDIHPNVARLHLTKLEDVKMVVSETKKNGKGGRPSRLYRLSEDSIQLHFPFRDYQLLSKIAIQTMIKLGEAGKIALFETGQKFGKELIQHHLPQGTHTTEDLTFEQKLQILKSASNTAGFYADYSYNEEKTKIFFSIKNCPFKEIAIDNMESVCGMHFAFIQGMFGILFTEVKLEESENMMIGCKSCSYNAIVVK